MAEINRIPDPVRPPQPVGGSSHKKPLRKREKGEFEEILEKKRDGADEEEGREDDVSGEDEEQGKPERRDRGLIVDELA